MNFVEELRRRNMLHDITPGAEEILGEGMQTGYIGFDPTAPSLTIGNYVQIMLLSFWQRCGHQPIFLLGGATGRIGDPSGKDKERDLKSFEELDRNLNFQKEQARKFLNFEEGKNKALMLNNLDFYREMNVLDFLRDVGKNLTVNYMLSKEAVKKRLETGLSYTEFSYQLLQAYDFLYLYKNYACRFQMGGSDQWGNITSGTEFIRRNITESKAYALTSPLLTKSDGKKFGKSEDGNIWLDPELTSPYKFYQFWINADDADLSKFLRTFSLKAFEEIQDLEISYKEDPRALKKILAEEITSRVHSPEDYKSVMEVSEILFSRNISPNEIKGMSLKAFKAVESEIPSFELPKEVLQNGTSIIEMLAEHTQICQSNADARRSVSNQAISINKTKVNEIDRLIKTEDLVHNSYLLIENGKKNKFLIKVH